MSGDEVFEVEDQVLESEDHALVARIVFDVDHVRKIDDANVGLDFMFDGSVIDEEERGGIEAEFALRRPPGKDVVHVPQEVACNIHAYTLSIGEELLHSMRHGVGGDGLSPGLALLENASIRNVLDVHATDAHAQRNGRSLLILGFHGCALLRISLRVDTGEWQEQRP